MEEARRFRVTGANRMVNQRKVYKDRSVARERPGKVGKAAREKASSERGLAKGKLERGTKREGEH